MINAGKARDDDLVMIKHFAAAGLFAGIALVSAPAASAADCGLVALLSPCVAPVPSPTPAPLPVGIPVVDAVTAPAPVPAPAPAPAAPAPAAPAPGAGTKAAVPAAADRIAQLVNQERAAAGLGALTPHSRAASIAAGHTMAMADRGDIWHNAAYFTAATRSALGAKALGENVAMNGSLEDAHKRLMASPGHRANILNGAFDAVGIAVVRDAGGTLYITQDFVDSSGAPAAAPRPAPAVKPVSAKPAAKPAAKATPVFRPAAVAAPVVPPVTPAPTAAPAPAPLAPEAVAPAADPTTDAGSEPATGDRFDALAQGALALLAAVGAAGTRFAVMVLRAG